MKRVLNACVIAQVSIATICGAASLAQSKPGERQGDGQGHNRQEINPAWLDKYAGVGREEDFRAALKEERAGWRFMLAKKWDLAINKFRQATDIYSTLPAAHMAIGEAIEHSGGPNSDAEAAYRTAIKLNNDDFRAWHKLAGVLYTQQKYVEARKALANSIMLNPPAHERKVIDRMINLIDSGQGNGLTNTTDQ